MFKVYSPGQALALDPVESPLTTPDTQWFVGDHQPRSIRLQAVLWTGTGNLYVKDYYGNQLFSGSTATITPVIEGQQHITVVAPLKYTVAAADGEIYFFGEFI